MKYCKKFVIAALFVCLLTSCGSTTEEDISFDNALELKDFVTITPETEEVTEELGETSETEANESDQVKETSDTEEVSIAPPETGTESTVPPETDVETEEQTGTESTVPPETDIETEEQTGAESTVPPETDVETEEQTDTESTVPPETDTETEEQTDAESTVPPETDTETEEQTDAESESESQNQTVSTQPSGSNQPLLDFDKLQQVNPNIHAWIEIPGMSVDNPILQHPTNDAYYLDHSYLDRNSSGGSLFTEATYNNKDFNDPVTIVYGHRTDSDLIFGDLQATYSDPTGFAEHKEVKVYLPGEVRTYTVFAAVPYNNTHILALYEKFESEYWYNYFVKDIRGIRSIGANFDDQIVPEPGDRVIILSCCLLGDRNSRYLVLAVLQDDLADNNQ